MLASIAGAIPGMRRIDSTGGRTGAMAGGATAGPGSFRHWLMMSGTATIARNAPKKSAWRVPSTEPAPAMRPAAAGPMSCPSDATNDRLPKRWSYVAAGLRLPTRVWSATTKMSWLRPSSPMHRSSAMGDPMNASAADATPRPTVDPSRNGNSPNRSICRPMDSARRTGATAKDAATSPSELGSMPISSARYDAIGRATAVAAWSRVATTSSPRNQRAATVGRRIRSGPRQGRPGGR